MIDASIRNSSYKIVKCDMQSEGKSINLTFRYFIFEIRFIELGMARKSFLLLKFYSNSDFFSGSTANSTVDIIFR
jgi:hypothetical protein